MLNSFHVPLVDDSDNSLLWAFVNLPEQIFISPVNENALEFWEKDVHVLDVPVNHGLVQALFSILMGLSVVQSDLVFIILIIIELVALILCFLVKVVWHIHSGFVEKSVPCYLVELWTHEISFGACLLSLFQCKLDLETRFEEVEGSWDSEVRLEGSTIGIESSPEHQCS